MSDVLKGVSCDDCFGTYDSHASGCRTSELDKLRTENERMKAVVEAARNLWKRTDSDEIRLQRKLWLALAELWMALAALDD